MILALFFYILGSNSHAEYRVFSILIENQKNSVTRQVQTTLDPEQYITLYPLSLNEKISYVDTWMCWGRTDGMRAHCENPALGQKPNLQQDRSPASN